MPNENPTAQAKDKKYNLVLLISSVLMLTALLTAFVLLFVFKADCDRQINEHRISQTVTPTPQFQKEDLHLSINQTIVFENAGAKGRLGIKNSNPKQQNILVEIYETASEQLIYRSYRIPNGFEIEEDYLSTKLEKGSYPCIAYFEILDEQDQVTQVIGTDLVVEVQN